MYTFENLIADKWKKVDTCWITLHGVRICEFSRWESHRVRHYSYVFTPLWDNWKSVGCPHIDGLPMEEVPLDHYVFNDRIPAFYYKRYIPSNREDWEDYAKMFGVNPDNRDSWEMMIAAKGRINEDKFMVEV